MRGVGAHEAAHTRIEESMKKALCSVALAVTLAIPALAHAGKRKTEEVSINTVDRWASGSLSSAYNSADGEQYIECWFYAADDYSSTGGCRAYIKSGSREISAQCWFGDNPVFATAVNSISSDSSVRFN